MFLKTKTLQVMTCIGLLLGATQASALSIEFQVSTDPINVGDIFTVDVIARDIFSGAGHSAIDEVTSFGYDWELSLAGVLATVGSPTLTPNLTNPYDDFSVGSIADVVAFAGLDPITNAAAQVDALITRFEFQALQVGSTVFGIDGSVPDQNLERGFYYFDLANAVGFGGEITIEVVDVAAVPVPGTALLMIIGLLGLARRRA